MSRTIKVVDIPPDMIVTEPVKKDWHSRSGHAYLVHDELTNSLIIGSKLKAIAAHLNDQYARSRVEHVSQRGLYEAVANKQGGYAKGLHKMRYRVSRCELADAHITFEQARNSSGAERASIVTETDAGTPVSS